MGERRLEGGFDGGATFVDDTVRRVAGQWTASVQKFLAYLRDRGFDGAPLPFGIDELGREVVTYLPGETVGNRLPWPAWTHSDEALIQVAGGCVDSTRQSWTLIQRTMPYGARAVFGVLGW